MPDTNNNPEVFGSTADLNAGGAVESVQAEEIKRLEQEKQQAEAASPTPQAAPINAADLMREAAEEAQARTVAAQARAVGFDSPAAPVSPALIPAPAPRRSSFDAAEANARAANASKGFPVKQDSNKLTSSAPKDAGSVFDAFAYDERIQAQNLAARGFASPDEWDAPADDPRIAPSPSYARVGMDEDLWGERIAAQGQLIDRVDAGFASRVPEYQQEIEATRVARAASIAGVVADSTSSLRGRIASFSAEWKNDVLPAYREWSNEPFAEKFDNFADTAARFGVDTGVLGERVRGVGAAAMSRVQEDFNTPYGKMQYGMAFGAVARSAGSYYEATNSGRYLTPEQQGEAQSGMLPGLLGAVGTVAGAAIPGVGSWAGGLIGQGVGGLAQGVLTAGYEREQAVRQTGDIYSLQTGQSADALKEFTEALRNTSAATKEVQAAFTTLSTAGPGMGAGTLPGVAFMSGALGERYNPALSGAAHALSADPILRALQPQLAATGGDMGGGLTGAGRLGDLSVAEAFSGDWGASNSFATLAEGSLTSKQYSDDMNRHSSVFSAGGAARFLTIGALFHPVQNTQDVQALGRLWTGQDDQYVPGADAERARLAKDRAQAYGLYTQGASAEEIAKTGMSLAASRLGIAENQGATDAQLAGTAQGLYSAVAQGVPKLTQEAAGIDGYLAGHPNMDAATRLKLQQTRDTALVDASGMEQQRSQTEKALFGRSLETEQSGFSLSAARSLYSGQSVAARAGIYRTQEDFLSGVADNPGPLSPSERNQLRESVLKQRHDFQEEGFSENAASYGLTASRNQSTITRGLLSGQTYEQLQGDEDRSVSANYARASDLRAEASQPNVPYTERMQKLAQAEDIETGAAVQRNQFLYAGIQQNIGQAQVAVGVAALGEAQAQITGGPQEHYEAAGASVRALTSEIDRLATALRQPGLTVDQRQGLERELTDTRRQSAQAQDTQQQAYLADVAHLTGTRTETASVGLDRTIRRGGNAAFDPAILALDRQAETEAQGRLDFDRRTTPGNTQRLADDALRVRQAQESVQQSEDVKNDYRPTSAFSRQMAGDRTAFQVALEAPYIRGGAESDPLTRGNAVIKDIRQDLAQNDANRQRGQRDGTWTDDNETAYSQHKNEDSLQLASMEREKRFALFNAIPNTIIGGGAMGNSVQSFSFDALTANYAPNDLVGSRGRPNIPRGGSLPGSLPGSPAEAFQQHAAGSTSSPASLATAIQSLSHGMNTQQLAALLTQLLQSNQELVRLVGSGQKLPGQGGPPLTGGSRTNQDNRQNFNSNRPAQR